MEKLYFYNTLGRKKEVFKPINKQVRVYTCGPTVYSKQHIGNMRAYLLSDFVKRILLYNGYKIKHVINVTDVGHLTNDSDFGEDKMEKAAISEGKTAKEISKYYFDLFHADIKKLNILEPNNWPKATDHIKEQIELIKKLEKKGYTYKTSDGIYFNSLKFKNYSKFAKLNLRGLEAGKRVSLGEKKHPSDFALWKFSNTNRQQEWNSPWGKGFPGWHIECSAMSIKYLGEHFDIHTGGEDHIPIHHTNEIAQSEAATGKKFVNYWIHGAFLTFKGEKVSKSTGGLYTISELDVNPLAFRYLCLLTHYRKPLNFTLEHLDAAQAAYDRIKRKVSEIHPSKKKPETNYEKLFLEKINDDLNMPEAIQVLIKMLDQEFNQKTKLQLVKKFDKVLGLDLLKKEEEIPAEIKKLANEREKARNNKNWQLADKLRAEIKERGFDIEDTVKGPKLSKTN